MLYSLYSSEEAEEYFRSAVILNVVYRSTEGYFRTDNCSRL